MTEILNECPCCHETGTVSWNVQNIDNRDFNRLDLPLTCFCGCEWRVHLTVHGHSIDKRPVQPPPENPPMDKLDATMITVYKVTANGLEELEASSVTESTVTLHGMRYNKVSWNPETYYYETLIGAVSMAIVMNGIALGKAREDVFKLKQAAEEIRQWMDIAKERENEVF